MKNIWNDPRSLFNGNHFSSMVDSVRTYVSNRHAHVRMSVCNLDRNVS